MVQMLPAPLALQYYKSQTGCDAVTHKTCAVSISGGAVTRRTCAVSTWGGAVTNKTCAASIWGGAVNHKTRAISKLGGRTTPMMPIKLYRSKKRQRRPRMRDMFRPATGGVRLSRHNKMNSNLEYSGDWPVPGVSNLDFPGAPFRTILLLLQKCNMAVPSHWHAAHQNTKMSHPICRAALKHPPHRGCANTSEIAATLRMPLRTSTQDWLRSGARSGLRAPPRRSTPKKQQVGLATGASSSLLFVGG